ncbi:trichothecene 3-O-acetyltransferase [Trichoderma guizhouense]|nr:trichothecene 3-O-acetyltransferase [Trichoderma guizhouense]
MAKTLRQPGIFGQLGWDTYTVVVLGFPDQPGVQQDEVMAALDKAAIKLLEAYPFLAGQVVKRGQSATSSGKYEIIPYPPHDGVSPVRRKDCTDLCPSYEQILRANAPFVMLDGDILCPKKGMGYVYTEETERPVFIIQANFVKGGLLLCFASMHNALDMNGQGIVLKMFAAAARGEELDAELVKAGNQDADTIVPLLKPGEIGLDHSDLRKPSSLGQSGHHGAPGKAPWNYWRFPADKLAKLKEIASTGRTWVSTNDAVTAFYIQRLTAVRLAANRVAPDEDVHCLRAVDGRRKLDPPVSEGYLGHLCGLADTAWPTARELVDGSLADAAISIRESLNRIDDFYMRSLATLINETEDKSTIFYAAKKKIGKDILISSWVQLHWLANCSFGTAIGVPDFVRRARLPELPDLVYMMPKNKEGHMDLGMSLFHEDFVGLANDAIWREFTELIG